MLTKRGWLLLFASATLVLGGRMLGVIELYALAAGAMAGVAAAVAYVRSSSFALEARRELRPRRVHAGSASRVELSVTNRDTRRSPVLSVLDPFDDGRRWARFLVAPLAPAERARAAYRLPTERRGIYSLGPLTVSRQDPLGLASLSMEGAPATELTVYPRIDSIEPLPYTLGQDPLAGADHPTALGPAGDEFYALRAYEVGDDLRRVHWASTAKLDELMIRQDEMPWQGRATVVLDLRSQVHSPESLELAISAAASILVAGARRRSLLRLVATDGTDSGFGAGAAHTDALLERLALADSHAGGDLSRVLAKLRRGGNGGALAVVTTGQAGTGDLSAAARLGARFGAVTVVVFERSSWDAWTTAAAPAPAAVPVPATRSGNLVRVTASSPFPAAWDQVLRRRARTGAPR